MLIFDILASFLAAALAALGVGGGGLLVIYLVLILKMEQHSAQALNLLFFTVASLAALPFHFKKKRVDLRTALVFSAFGLPGAWLGSFLSSKARPDTVRFCFGLMLTVAGGFTLIKTSRYYLKKLKSKSIRDK